MLKDGHYDRALMALQSVDLEDEKKGRERFYTLQRLAYMNLNDFVAAKDSLQSASWSSGSTYLCLPGANLLFLKKLCGSFGHIDKAGEHKRQNPSLISIQAQSY